jgi:type VI secretion system protein ImpL
MPYFFHLVKHYALRLLRQFKSATPVLLLLGAIFLLIAIWWLGPQWNWHDKKPLASLTVRVCAQGHVLEPAQNPEYAPTFLTVIPA